MVLNLGCTAGRWVPHSEALLLCDTLNRRCLLDLDLIPASAEMMSGDQGAWVYLQQEEPELFLFIYKLAAFYAMDVSESDDSTAVLAGTLITFIDTGIPSAKPLNEVAPLFLVES